MMKIFQQQYVFDANIKDFQALIIKFLNRHIKR
jgi:hypothetical protein